MILVMPPVRDAHLLIQVHAFSAFQGS